MSRRIKKTYIISSAQSFADPNKEFLASLDKLADNEGLRKRLGKAAEVRASKQFEFNKIVHEQVLPLYFDKIK